MTLPTFPYEVKKGNSIVKIYRHTNGKYDEFKVSFYAAGKRKMETFADFEKAKKRAEKINDSVNSGNADALTIAGRDRIAFSRATVALQPTGVALDLAALQFAEAFKLLNGVSVVEAARFYVKKHSTAIVPRTVEKAIDEFIEAKTSAKRSSRHVFDLKFRLGKLKEAFKCDMTSVAEPELAAFMNNLKTENGTAISPRSRNNFRASLNTFFRWSIKKKFLPADWNEFASIENVEDGEGDIEIFTPEELAELLAHADEQIVPFLVIGAFAGLRSSEICRLDWKQIGVGQGKYIEVKAKDARKTRQRRLVPISDNLREWLKPYRKAKGRIWPQCDSNLYWFVRDLAATAKVPWKNNALRHSFISYRMAEIQDASKVSLEAGNSPQMVFANYRELVTPEEATRWFSIKPSEGKEKVIWLKAA